VCVNACTLASFVKEIAIPDSNVVRISPQSKRDCERHGKNLCIRACIISRENRPTFPPVLVFGEF